MGDSRETYRILAGKPLEEVHLEDKEGDGRIMLIFILCNGIVGTESRWNWLKIVSILIGITGI
jgi:hypothetical protein